MFDHSKAKYFKQFNHMDLSAIIPTLYENPCDCILINHTCILLVLTPRCTKQAGKPRLVSDLTPTVMASWLAKAHYHSARW